MIAGSLPESPFQTWEFFNCVDEARGDVEVVTLHDSGRIVGCFPFQRRHRRQAVPAAALLNDMHGPIVHPPQRFDFEQILRVAGLSRFDFHASPSMPWNSATHTAHDVPAYRADLGLRSGDYVDRLLDERYSIRQQLRKTRALERNLGPLRFDWQTGDEAIFERLLAWKSRRYQAMGTHDLFAHRWTVELLRSLLRLDSNAMHGQLSALYAGNELVAVHYGLRCGHVLHSWFPAYSIEHSTFSPGMEMFLQLARRAPSEGVTTLDLGYGDEPFKAKLTNRRYAVKCGSVHLVPWRRTLSSWSRTARSFAKQLPWSKGVKRAIRRASSTLVEARYR